MLKRNYFFAFFIAIIFTCIAKGQSYKEINSFNRGIRKLIDNREKIWLQITKDSTVDQDLLEEKFTYKNKNGTIDTFEYLFPREKIILYYWAKAYKKILESTNDLSFHDDNQYRKILKKEKYELLDYYGNDSLLNNILKKTRKLYRWHRQKIRNSNELSNKEKEFLIIYLRSIYSYENLDNIPIEYIKKESETYLKKYPKGKYSTFINNSITPSYKKSLIGFGGGFYTGYTILHGDIHKYFGNGIPVGASINVAYKKFTFITDFSGSTSIIKQNFELNDEGWSKNMIPTITSWRFGFGYMFREEKKTCIIPFAGFSSTGITAVKDDDYIQNERSSNDEYSDNDQVNFNQFPSYFGGISYLYKLKYIKSNYTYHDAFKSQTNHSFWYIKLTAGYNNPLFENVDNRFKGQHIYINIGIGTFVHFISKTTPNLKENE